MASYISTIVVIGSFLCTEALGARVAALEVSVKKISVKLVPKESQQAEVCLILNNRSKEPVCIFPSVFTLNFVASYEDEFYDNEGNLLIGMGSGSVSAVMSTAVRTVSDLDLETLVVAPGKSAELSVILRELVDIPLAKPARLCLQYVCNPRYPGDSYRGVAICRDELKTCSDVIIEQSLQLGEIIIRPVPPKRETDRPRAFQPPRRGWRLRRAARSPACGSGTAACGCWINVKARGRVFRCPTGHWQ